MGYSEIEDCRALKMNGLNWWGSDSSVFLWPVKTAARFAKPLQFTTRGKQPGSTAGSGNARRLCTQKNIMGSVKAMKVFANTCSVSNSIRKIYNCW